MKYLYDPVRFDDKPLLWGHKSRSESAYVGFYHLHQCCEILFVHEGQGSVIVNQKTYEIRRGMLFFFQPFKLHRVFANVSQKSPYVRTLIHFDPVSIADSLRPFPERHSFFTQLWKGQNAELVFDLLADIDYEERIFQMYDHAASQGKGESDEEMTLLFLQLLNTMKAFHQSLLSQEALDGESRSLHYSEMIMQWLEEHYMEDVFLDDVAAALHLSKFYVSRIFQQETGSSITDYLTARRIKQACRLLQTTSLPVERIGIEIGYPNVSYFIRLFKHVVGTTPLKYKKNS
jgi:AraC-like DNA-binding protein